MYGCIRALLFKLDPELSHAVALRGLKFAYQTGLLSCLKKPASHPRSVMGLTFPNPVGLAAGLDKNGEYIDALSALGFGFIEIGTVTPKPQAGNPKPRLFRLVEQEAIINRMGFNSKGADYVVRQLQKTRYRGILGINIGKNKETPIEHAIDDYVFGFRQFWQYASYITINVSSPNTPHLRDLQQENFLGALLSTLKREQQAIFSTHQKYVPLVVKIAPDLSDEALKSIAHVLLSENIDGVIATNTTTSRIGVEQSPYANEQGGLSGYPLAARSTAVIKQLHAVLQNSIPIIASGGVMSAAAAQEKLSAGAQLVEIYSGFVYHGIELIQKIAAT